MVTFGNTERGICTAVEISEDFVQMKVDSDEFGLRGFSFVSSDGLYTDIGRVVRTTDETGIKYDDFLIIG